MTRFTLASVFALCCLVSHGGDAAARQLRAAYRATVYTESWVPIRLADLRASISQRVVEALSRKGKLVLVPAPAEGDPTNADLLLEIEGDLVGEASSFVVTLSLRALRDPTLPSFAASATGVMKGLKKAHPKRRKALIFAAIIRAAAGAATRLSRAFDSHHGGARSAGAAPRVAEMFDWTTLSPPGGRHAGRDFATFASARARRDQRMAAGARLSALAYDNNAVRHLFERTAMTDPDPIIRGYALKYLEPAARKHRFTQRVVLSVLREDNDPHVKMTAFGMSPSFLSRLTSETVQTWVELLRSKPAEFTRMRDLEKLMQDRLDTPNLDSALLECLQHKAILISTSSTRKGHCMSLANKLPGGRRLRLLLAYVGGPGAPTDRREREKAARSLQSAVAVKRGGFRESLSISRLAAAAYRRLSEPRFKRALVSGLLSNYPHPGLVAVIEDAIERLEDPGLVKAAVRWVARIGDPRRQRYAPWAVMSWGPAERLLEKLKSDPPGKMRSSDARSMQRHIEKGLAGIRAQREMAQRKDLNKHLDADELPKAGALDYFIGCLLGSAEPAVQTDCAAGIHWLAVLFPGTRREAVAAAAGLLQQKRRTIVEPAREVLEDAPRTVSSHYRGFTRRYCRRGVCCEWRGM